MSNAPLGHFIRLTRRVRLFVRDYLNEFGIAWSIARHRDCERNGGHRWDQAREDEVLGWSQTCSRCGTSQTLTRTSGTAATNATTIKVG